MLAAFLMSLQQPRLSDAEIERMAAATLPSERQMEWHRLEYTAFIHFGVNTFTGREWGTGKEDPAIFNPVRLDADQWCRTLKEAGMKMVIFTAKHHDGFCLWPSRYTDHSVASSPWRGGRGDVVREVAIAAKRHGLRLGIYLSPADLFQIESPGGLYGNGSKPSQRTVPRPVPERPFGDARTFQFEVDDYNEYFLNQLYELLTEYGPVHEVWLDGAKPKDRGGQQYAYPAWYLLIRELAPQAVIFGKGPDVRWCGNEAGDTRSAEWSVVGIPTEPDRYDWPDMTDRDLGSTSRLREALERGGRLHHYPAETDTSIREGWFWRDEEQRVKGADEIFDIYERTIGGNSVLLLNVPPNRDGLLPERDSAVLREVGARIEAAYGPSGTLPLLAVFPSGGQAPREGAEFEFSLAEPGSFDRLSFEEPIAEGGQRIARFRIEARHRGEWSEIGRGETVGYRRIVRFPLREIEALRIVIESSRGAARISRAALHRTADQSL